MMPPGQKIRADFPRFGLPQYAKRFPSRPTDRSLSIKIHGSEHTVSAELMNALPRATIESEFHCVTTWSCADLRWSGIRFSDFLDQCIAPTVTDAGVFLSAILRGQDGYQTTLVMEDLMAQDVLIADALNGLQLGVDHGAPLRLVAPKNYGYKSVKHLCSIEFVTTTTSIKRGISAFLDHPRARVLHEERGRWLPGWLLRPLYRTMINGTSRQFREALLEYEPAKCKS